MAECTLQKWAPTDITTHVIFSWGEAIVNSQEETWYLLCIPDNVVGLAGL